MEARKRRQGNTPWQPADLEVLNEVDELQAEKNNLQQQLQTYRERKGALEPWGNFEPEKPVASADAGLSGFPVVRRQFTQWEDDL